MPKLNSSDYAELSAALEACLDCDNGASDRVGEHFTLMYLLGQLGYRVNSWQAAENKARELLDG